MRRGVTLLITLSVIAAMLALIGVLFGYLEQARSHADSKASMIQADLLREDLGQLLAKYLKEKPSASTLKQLYATPLPIYNEKGTFGVLARCRPFLDRIPLVWLGWKENASHRQHHRLARRLFERLSDEAELREPGKLYELILRQLNGIHQEFGNTGNLGQKSGTLTPETFREILDDYRFLADDPRVYRVDWEKYFQIRSSAVPPEGIDKDFLAPAIVSFLFDLDPALVREEYSPGDLDKFLRSVGESAERYQWLFRNRPAVAMHCNLLYSFREGQYNASFDYLDKRIENFELQKQ